MTKPLEFQIPPVKFISIPCMSQDVQLNHDLAVYPHLLLVVHRNRNRNIVMT